MWSKTKKWARTLRWQKFWPLVLTVLTTLTIYFIAPSAIARSSGAMLLPEAQIHPLPPSLAKLGVSLPSHGENLEDPGDYFDQIKPSPMGYLLWSDFPVTIAVEYPPNLPPDSAEEARYYTWQQAIKTAIANWQTFFPLAIVNDAATADIRIFYREPPLARKVDPQTGLISFGQARTAQTSYEFYWTGQNPPQLSHRMSIDIKPGLAALSLQATARHELGHALGIWGHSDRPEDALYPAQTAEAPPISPRDLRTLYRIYQQPTHLGWPSPVPN